MLELVLCASGLTIIFFNQLRLLISPTEPTFRKSITSPSLSCHRDRTLEKMWVESQFVHLSSGLEFYGGDPSDNGKIVLNCLISTGITSSQYGNALAKPYHNALQTNTILNFSEGYKYRNSLAVSSHITKSPMAS